MLDVEFALAMAMCHLSPSEVDYAVAGWETWVNVMSPVPYVRTGFVVKRKDGRYSYLTTHRVPKDEYFSSTTQTFDEEPTYLYDRGVNWVFDAEELNARTQIGKQEANYPTGGLEHSIGTSPVVRFSRPL